MNLQSRNMYKGFIEIKVFFKDESKISHFCSLIEYYVYKNYLDTDRDDASVYKIIHCSIQESASLCCSSFSNCYIAIHLISGLELSRL